MPLALVLVVLAAAWRIIAVYEPAFGNFSPLMALVFCGAVYFRNRWLWLVPLIALTATDVFLDRYYAAAFGEKWLWQSEGIRGLCFAMALPIGWMVARRKNWFNLAAGAVGSSLLFYLLTNTDAWLRDPHYAKTVAGWGQALTIGRPEFPSTLWFFRNTFLSDLLFTGLFAAVMEYAALRAGKPSLLARRAAVRR